MKRFVSTFVLFLGMSTYAQAFAPARSLVKEKGITVSVTTLFLYRMAVIKLLRKWT